LTTNKKPKSKSRSKKTKEKAQEIKFPEKDVPMPPYMRFLDFIHGFLNDAECAKDMFATVIPALKEQDKKVMGKIKKTGNLLLKGARSKGSRKSIGMHHIEDLLKYVRKLNRAETMFRGNALVGIVSRYDEFVSAILKNAYSTNPGRATAGDKALTYDELLTLDSIDNVVELFVAKEIDGLLRESHKKQIETIDREFKTGIIDNFSEFPQFIEIMERRNLLVHAGGITSKYYLRLCNDVGYNKRKLPKEGTPLSVDEEYFHESILCLSEMAVRLGYSLAFRIYRDKLKEINERFLAMVGFPLLMSEEWELAWRVFSFALSWPEKYIPEDLLNRIYVINAAIALNQLDRRGEAMELLEKLDWSASDPKFLLGVAVLRHEWKKAESLMSEMDGKKPFTEEDFRSWPIFKEFRNTKEFRRAYKAIYGKRFVVRLSKDESDFLKKKSEQGAPADATKRRG